MNCEQYGIQILNYKGYIFHMVNSSSVKFDNIHVSK